MRRKTAHGNTIKVWRNEEQPDFARLFTRRNDNDICRLGKMHHRFGTADLPPFTLRQGRRTHVGGIIAPLLLEQGDGDNPASVDQGLENRRGRTGQNRTRHQCRQDRFGNER